MESQNILIKDGVTDHGCRIELISSKITDEDGKIWLMRKIDIDDVRICEIKMDIGADPNGWASEQLYSTFSMMF